MNNPNPFLPQGSLLDQKSKKRKRVKVAVFTIFAINIAVLSPLLIQGCKKDQKDQTDNTTSPSLSATNAPAETASNQPPTLAAPETNLPPVVSAPPTNVAPPVTAPPPVTPAPNTEATPSEYVVAKGDSFYSIGKKLGVSIKALKAANPSVVPTKLKVGQKIQVPAGGTSAGNANAAAGSMGVAPSETAETVYVVRSRDTLTKIAHEHGVSVKALRAANELKTDSIKVGQKLKVPAKPTMASTPPATDTANTTAGNPAPATNPASAGATGQPH